MCGGEIEGGKRRRQRREEGRGEKRGILGEVYMHVDIEMFECALYT